MRRRLVSRLPKHLTKVLGPGSFGQDGGIDPEEDGSAGRPINALSGFPGSVMREAAAAGMPVGIVNDGDLPEPGTGVFLTEVGDRNLSNEIARQMLDGRPGFEGEPLPKVLLGVGPAPADDERVTTSTGNPTGIGLNQGFALDSLATGNRNPISWVPVSCGIFTRPAKIEKCFCLCHNRQHG